MKLYYHPASTTSRPILLFAAENGLALDMQVVDSIAGFGRGTGGTNSDFGFHWFAGV